MISSILGVSVTSTAKDDLQQEGDCSPKESNQDLNRENSCLSGVEENESLEINEDIIRTGEDCESCDSVKLDYSLTGAEETVRTNRTEQGASSNLHNSILNSKAERTENSRDQSKKGTEETKELERNNGEVSFKSVLDVINGCFGEGGDTLLHVASRSSRTDIVSMLLESGADPALK